MSTYFIKTCKSEIRKGKSAEMTCYLQRISCWVAYEQYADCRKACA
jgi:hypothetical protein